MSEKLWKYACQEVKVNTEDAFRIIRLPLELSEDKERFQGAALCFGPIYSDESRLEDYVGVTLFSELNELSFATHVVPIKDVVMLAETN